MIYTTALAEFFAVWALLFQLNLTMETLIPNTVSVHVKVTHFTMQNLTINPWGSPRKHCFPLSNAPVYASLFFVRNVEIAARLPLTFVVYSSGVILTGCGCGIQNQLCFHRDGISASVGILWRHRILDDITDGKDYIHANRCHVPSDVKVQLLLLLLLLHPPFAFVAV